MHAAAAFRRQVAGGGQTPYGVQSAAIIMLTNKQPSLDHNAAIANLDLQFLFIFFALRAMRAKLAATATTLLLRSNLTGAFQVTSAIPCATCSSLDLHVDLHV